ncbi:hypothetical protein ACLOJK_023989 [Asimina triloba]
MVGFGRTAGSCYGHRLDAGCVWWVVVHLDGRWIEGQGRQDRQLFGVRRREELLWVAPLDGCSPLDLEGRRRRTPAIDAVGVMGERAGAAMGVMDGRTRLQARTARWVADEARGFCLQGMNHDGFSAGRCLGCLRWMKMGLGRCWSVEDSCCGLLVSAARLGRRS